MCSSTIVLQKKKYKINQMMMKNNSYKQLKDDLPIQSSSLFGLQYQKVVKHLDVTYCLKQQKAKASVEWEEKSKENERSTGKDGEDFHINGTTNII